MKLRFQNLGSLDHCFSLLACDNSVEQNGGDSQPVPVILKKFSVIFAVRQFSHELFLQGWAQVVLVNNEIIGVMR